MTKEVYGTRRRTKKNPWLDEECEQAIKSRGRKKKRKWLEKDRKTYLSANKCIEQDCCDGREESKLITYWKTLKVIKIPIIV